ITILTTAHEMIAEDSSVTATALVAVIKCLTCAPRRDRLLSAAVRFLRFGLRFFGPSPGQNIWQAIVAFVASVFIEARRQREFVLTAPRLGPGLGVFECEGIVQLGR